MMSQQGYDRSPPLGSNVLPNGIDKFPAASSLTAVTTAKENHQQQQGDMHAMFSLLVDIQNQAKESEEELKSVNLERRQLEMTISALTSEVDVLDAQHEEASNNLRVLESRLSIHGSGEKVVTPSPNSLPPFSPHHHRAAVSRGGDVYRELLLAHAQLLGTEELIQENLDRIFRKTTDFSSLSFPSSLGRVENDICVTPDEVEEFDSKVVTLLRDLKQEFGSLGTNILEVEELLQQEAELKKKIEAAIRETQPKVAAARFFANVSNSSSRRYNNNNHTAAQQQARHVDDYNSKLAARQQQAEQQSRNNATQQTTTTVYGVGGVDPSSLEREAKLLTQAEKFGIDWTTAAAAVSSTTPGTTATTTENVNNANNNNTGRPKATLHHPVPASNKGLQSDVMTFSYFGETGANSKEEVKGNKQQQEQQVERLAPAPSNENCATTFYPAIPPPLPPPTPPAERAAAKQRDCGSGNVAPKKHPTLNLSKTNPAVPPLPPPSSSTSAAVVLKQQLPSTTAPPPPPSAANLTTAPSAAIPTATNAPASSNKPMFASKAVSAASLVGRHGVVPALPPPPNTVLGSVGGGSAAGNSHSSGGAAAPKINFFFAAAAAKNNKINGTTKHDSKTSHPNINSTKSLFLPPRPQMGNIEGGAAICDVDEDDESFI